MSQYQSPVQQSGTITPGHPVQWVTDGVVKDAGPPSNGTLTGVGVISSGIGFQQNSGPITGNYTSLSSGFVNGVPTIFVGGTQGESVLNFDLNGTTYQIPGSLGSANLIVPLPNINNLRSQTTSTLSVNQCMVLGYYTTGDQGGGLYWYNHTDTTSSDNGGTIIVDASNRRWYLETFGQPLNVKQFGATGNGTTDDTAAIQAALNAAASLNIYAVYFPPGVYFVSETITIPNNFMLYGNDPDTTIIYRTDNYGDTFVSGVSGGGGGCGSITFRNLWCNHGAAFYSGSGALVDPATSGGHVRLYGSQQALFDNCYFWRLPYNIIIHGGTVTRINRCSFAGVWDPTNSSAQEGVASVWMDPSTPYGNPKDLFLFENEFTGCKSDSRSVTLTDSNGNSKTVTWVANIGAQSLLLVNGCETLTSIGNYYGTGSLFNVYLNPTSSGFVANVKMVGDLQDGAGTAHIRVLSQTTNNPVSHLTMTGVQINGETNSARGFDVLAQSGAPSLYDLAVTGCTVSATYGSSFVITGAVAYRVTGNTFTSYNCLEVTPNSTPIDAQFASAGYCSGPDTVDYYGIIDNNIVGGGINSFQSSDSYCWLPFYLDADQDKVSVRNTMFVNVVNTFSTAQNGIQEDYPVEVTTNATCSPYRRAYPCNTSSSALTLNLPQQSPQGNEIIIFDISNNAATNNITINPNGGRINGSTSNLVISTNSGSVRLYNNNDNNWYVIS